MPDFWSNGKGRRRMWVVALELVVIESDSFREVLFWAIFGLLGVVARGDCLMRALDKCRPESGISRDNLYGSTPAVRSFP